MIRRATCAATTIAAATTPITPAAFAATSITNNPRDSIQQAQSTLSSLLDNWQRATVDCTFADVPRDLLQQKNKQLLLEKASTSALFDKSASVETCKTTNRIVRDYLGVTGKGPLVGIEKTLKLAMDDVEVDRLEDYINEMESFQQNMAKASSLSYTAGTADFDAVNNFDKQDADNLKQDSNLEQSRRAIADAKNSLDRMMGMVNDS